MFFAILTLVCALSISAIAAYFSIIGLATIFPGSTTAVVIMGSVLEVGKIAAAVWLHRNWKQAPRLIKGYLTGAVLVLMGITSMGIFGFLSKAHIEHQHTLDKSTAIISQIDNKISREKIMQKLYTVQEVADILKVSKKTIYRMIKVTKKLKAVKVGQWRIKKEDLDKLLK